MSRISADAQVELKEYLKRFPNADPLEIAELNNWVQQGHSPYENGDGLCRDDGSPLDFISAMRFWDELCGLDPDEVRKMWGPQHARWTFPLPDRPLKSYSTVFTGLSYP